MLFRFFDARWGVLGAADVGANHQRDRIWIVAKWRGQLSYAQHDRIRRWEQQQKSVEKEARKLADTRCELWETWDTTRVDTETQIGSTSRIHNKPGGERQNVSNTDLPQCEGMCKSERVQPEYAYARDSRWWQTEPDVGRMVNGLASGTHRLKAIGNGQVPLCAATAWRILSGD